MVHVIRKGFVNVIHSGEVEIWLVKPINACQSMGTLNVMAMVLVLLQSVLGDGLQIQTSSLVDAIPIFGELLAITMSLARQVVLQGRSMRTLLALDACPANVDTSHDHVSFP